MSVSVILPVVSYEGNASSVTPYPTQFYFETNADVKVRVVDAEGVSTDLVLGVGYNVTGATNVGGGDVVTTAAHPDTSTIIISRSPSITQTLALAYAEVIPSAALEKNLDKITFILQLHAHLIQQFSGVLTNIQSIRLDSDQNVIVTTESGSFLLPTVPVTP
jgi:hypothetical protein